MKDRTDMPFGVRPFSRYRKVTYRVTQEHIECEAHIEFCLGKTYRQFPQGFINQSDTIISVGRADLGAPCSFYFT